jgi:hypothetical protein
MVAQGRSGLPVTIWLCTGTVHCTVVCWASFAKKVCMVSFSRKYERTYSSTISYVLNNSNLNKVDITRTVKKGVYYD